MLRDRPRGHRNAWRFAILVISAVPGHRHWLSLGPACARASETHEQTKQKFLGAGFQKLGRIKAAPPFGGHLECLVLLRRGLAQLCLVGGVPFLPSNALKEQSLRCYEILVPLLQSPAPLTPPCSQPGRATWTLPLPPFLFLPASLGHPPPLCQLTPLFTHRGGCYSLWQQGPWQPTSHLGEATLLPWQREA